MKNFITTLKNIWEIKELKERILFTLFMLFVFRIGSFVLLPGVNAEILQNAIGTDGNNANGLTGMLGAFTGGAFNKAAIFALGIMPYISASIIVQLLGFAVPYFQKLQTQEGESGRKKLNQITRVLTILITLVQGTVYLNYIQGLDAVTVSSTVFFSSGILILTSGTIFAMWMGERITEKGIGNGISLLIMIGIISSLPTAFAGEFESLVLNGNGPLMFALEMIFFFLVLLVTVLVYQAVRKIPVSYPKRMVGRDSSSRTSNATDSIPVKLIAAGVMPIIFAQAIMFLPGALSGVFKSNNETLSNLSDFTSWEYNVVLFFVVVIFTYVYTALQVNPKNYANYLKQSNAFIPGVKPGENTESFIDNIVSRVTLPGAIFLGLVSILPAVVVLLFGSTLSWAIFFGGTSLLIMVGVVLDTLRQIESHLLMKKYDGLIKSGRIGGRQSQFQQIGASM